MMKSKPHIEKEVEQQQLVIRQVCCIGSARGCLHFGRILFPITYVEPLAATSVL
jgi:hypothetical protein